MFWFYSHPAVYVMILPAMGMISEILPVFSRKPLFGYKAFIFATAGIGALGFSVWAHHMFTTGSVYLPFFSLMTFLIAVPTGVKMFNWVFTLWGGQLMLRTPLLFALGFLTMFLIGGINGAFSAAVPVDFALHDTYWVVAHLHYVLFGGSVFGLMAGFYYWFPKMTGRMMNETLGKVQFVLMFIGFNLTFFPMHELGLAGMPRRIADYSSVAGWNDLNLLATIGGFTIAALDAPVPVERLHLAAERRRRPATTHGRRTRSSGRRPRRLRPTTSTGCPRSGPSGRCSTSATARRPSTDGTSEMTADPHALTTDRAQPRRGLPPRFDRGDQQPGPRDAAVHHLRGDVLLGPVRRLLQRPGQCPAVAAGRVRPHAPDPAPRGAGHGPADPELIHVPVRRLGDPTRRSRRIRPQLRGHHRPRGRVPR